MNRKLGWNFIIYPIFFGYLFLGTALPSHSQENALPEINRPTLKIGSRGDIVSELQAALKLLGYYDGEVDGIYSASSALAVSRFQEAAGLNTNGIVDSSTWERLFPISLPQETASTYTSRIDSNNSTDTETSNSNNTSTTNSNSSNNTDSSNTTNTSTNKDDSNTSNTSTNTNTNAQLTAANMPLLKEGMEGDAVKRLQERLSTLGFFKGAIDGVFGVGTLQAVIAAQTSLGLDADGIVGFDTWQKLLSE